MNARVEELLRPHHDRSKNTNASSILSRILSVKWIFGKQKCSFEVAMTFIACSLAAIASGAISIFSRADREWRSVANPRCCLGLHSSLVQA